jgi:hypothetical protein
MIGIKLLEEKATNCGKWLCTLEPCKQSRLPKTLEEYAKKPADFDMWVQTVLIPKEHDLDILIDELAEQHNLKVKDFKEEDRLKFKRYLQCFIDIGKEINS